MIGDSNVTRREEQLDQLCNLLLLKLESDKQGKSNRSEPVEFRSLESPATTGDAVRANFARLCDQQSEVFVTDKDREIRFNDETIAACVDTLAGLKLIDLGVSTIALAFQVLRSEALKQNEGQYFTPQAVIQAGVKLLQIQFPDLILDPACGSGGFLIECMMEMQRTRSDMDAEQDIRGLRVNINPTNLVTESVARRFWRGGSSGLRAWDLITPNRASSNIGEFAILLPGEERLVLTKEVFIFRVSGKSAMDPFYLLWALSLRAVREQWRRIALMQTNREDCGDRYREVLIPKPESAAWAAEASGAFRDYFTKIAAAREEFADAVNASAFKHVANVAASVAVAEASGGEGDERLK